jgi:hypothetical protein
LLDFSDLFSFGLGLFLVAILFFLSSQSAAPLMFGLYYFYSLLNLKFLTLVFLSEEEIPRLKAKNGSVSSFYYNS